MKPLTNDEYQFITSNFASQLELIKHGIVGNGVQSLIPIYERITETKMNINCTDCYKGMMLVIKTAVNNYIPQTNEQ